MRRLLASLLLVSAIIFGLASPALAINNSPSTLVVSRVDKFQNVLETGDLLFFSDFTVSYNVTPSETIDTTYIMRLLSSTGVELTHVAPYAYWNNGYARGMTAMYFSAASATALGMTFGGSYRMRLDGNPSASWSAMPIPQSTEVSSFTQWSANTTAAADLLVTGQIKNYYAPLIQAAWISQGFTSTLYGQSAVGAFLLTSTGVGYFSAVFPYLSQVCPSIMPSVSTDPQIILHPTNTRPTLQQVIDNFYTGTVFDLSGLATLWLNGQTRVLTTILWLVVMIVVIVGIAGKVRSYKPAVLVSFPLIIGGTLLSWVAVTFAIFLGFMCGVLTWYVFTYEKSVA